MEIRDRQLQLIELLGNRIDQEHSLISSRMTWLMTQNGFLFAAFALLVANARYFYSANILATLIATICLTGAISNASAFYSHYWASRAIREADLATRWALPQASDNAIAFPVGLFRLAGRDPKSEEGLGPPKSTASHPIWPPQRLVHPWFLLPLTTCVVFVALPFAVSTINIAEGRPHDGSNWLAALALAGVAGLAILFATERWQEFRSTRSATEPPS